MIEYNFENVQSLSHDERLDKYHIYVENTRWMEMMNLDDLRFFLHRKNLLNDLIENDNGIMIKITSWDDYDLREEYELSNKINHPNLFKNLCYFELEEDIINFLCLHPEHPELHQDSAIIISKYYRGLWYDVDINILKQIIYTLYTLLFHFKIELKSINMKNIYVDETARMIKIKYKIDKYSHELKTKNVVKIDEHSNSVKIGKNDKIEDRHCMKLLDNIHDILLQINTSASREICTLIRYNRDVFEFLEIVNILC